MMWVIINKIVYVIGWIVFSLATLIGISVGVRELLVRLKIIDRCMY